ARREHQLLVAADRDRHAGDVVGAHVRLDLALDQRQVPGAEGRVFPDSVETHAVAGIEGLDVARLPALVAMVVEYRLVVRGGDAVPRRPLRSGRLGPDRGVAVRIALAVAADHLQPVALLAELVEG